MGRNTKNFKDYNRMITIDFEKTEEERKEKIFIKTCYINFLLFFILTKVWNDFYKETLLFSFKNNHVVDNIYISYFYIYLF